MPADLYAALKAALKGKSRTREAAGDLGGASDGERGTGGGD